MQRYRMRASLHDREGRSLRGTVAGHQSMSHGGVSRGVISAKIESMTQPDGSSRDGYHVFVGHFADDVSLHSRDAAETCATPLSLSTGSLYLFVQEALQVATGMDRMVERAVSC